MTPKWVPSLDTIKNKQKQKQQTILEYYLSFGYDWIILAVPRKRFGMVFHTIYTIYLSLWTKTADLNPFRCNIVHQINRMNGNFLGIYVMTNNQIIPFFFDWCVMAFLFKPISPIYFISIKCKPEGLFYIWKNGIMDLRQEQSGSSIMNWGLILGHGLVPQLSSLGVKSWVLYLSDLRVRASV